MTRRRLAWALGVVAVTVLGLLTALWMSLQAPPLAPELAAREAPSKRTVVSQKTGSFVVAGHVLDEDGQPVDRNVAVSDVFTGELLVQGRTDGEGAFSFQVDRPARLFVRPSPVDPGDVTVVEGVDALLFMVPRACPHVVEVVDSEGSLVDARLAIWVQAEGWPRQVRYVAAPEGVYRDAFLVCGAGTMIVQAEGFGAVEVPLDTLAADTTRVVMQPGVRVYGDVTDLEGNPVARGHVSLNSGVPRQRFEGGAYEVWVQPGLWRLGVSGDTDGAIGYGYRPLEVDVGDEAVRLDVRLDAYQAVQVYCAGLPQDLCHGVTPIRCDHGVRPAAWPCRESWGGAVDCSCPLSEGVVRSPDDQLAVQPGQSEVWLDYRDRGAIVGQFVGCPEPGECAVLAGTLSIGLTGTPPARQVQLDSQGRFELRGLQAGTWAMGVRWSRGALDLPDVELEPGEVVDLGVVDIGGAGGVAGQVVDGLTGGPVDHEPVVVRSVEHDSAVNPIGSLALTDARGGFQLTGLAPGTYDVFLAKRPFDAVEVVVDGALVDGLAFETAAASVLDEQGFDVDDDLVVTGLDPEGWAAEAGLWEGDRIVGVTMVGLDTTWMSTAYSEQAAQAVLRHYSGEVGLVVERDGRWIDIVLE